MEKSVDAFRTISEVADDLQLPQHVLRFWETRFPQIRPLKRAGGRRYYRPNDVFLLGSIRKLLYDQGYTIKGVQRLLKDKGGREAQEERDTADDLAELEPSPGPDLQRSADAPSQTASRMPLHRADPPDGSLRMVEVDCAELRETLTIITDCERILEALRHPCR